MSRLPTIDGDDGTWGIVLNDYLSQQHQADGTHKYDSIIQSGLDSAKPTAAAANSGLLYFSTDVQGGTLYRSNGSSWDQLARGVTQAPVAHKSTHAIGGTDVLSPTDIGAVAKVNSKSPDGTGNVTLAASDVGAMRNTNTSIFYPEDYGAVGDGVTDDTAAIQSAIDAAFAANQNSIVKFGPKTYLVNGGATGLRTDRNGYCLLSLANASGSTKNVALIGTPHMNGWAVDKTVLKCTRTGDTYSATFGPPSVIGSVTDENGGGSVQWSGVISIYGINISLPLDPSIAGVDGLGFGGCDLKGIDVQAGTGNDATSPATHAHAFGVRMPTKFGFGVMRLESSTFLQLYAGVVAYTCDHILIYSVDNYKCVVGLALQEPQGGQHPIAGGYLMVESCNYAIAGWTASGGVQSLTTTTAPAHIMNLHLDLEIGTAPFSFTSVILDANNLIEGDILINYWAGIAISYLTTSLINGAGKLRIRETHTGTIQTITAASTVTLPPGGEYFTVSGTTGIDTITASYVGRRVTLNFGASAVANNGTGNLRLSSAYVTSAVNSTLTLVCDGTNWIEVSRSSIRFRTSHTFSFQGTVSVVTLPSFFVPVRGGQLVNTFKARYKIASGTNVTFKIQKNGADWTGFGTTAAPLTATTTTTDTTQANSIADNDEISLVILGVSGTPANLTVSLVLEHIV